MGTKSFELKKIKGFARKPPDPLYIVWTEITQLRSSKKRIETGFFANSAKLCKEGQS